MKGIFIKKNNLGSIFILIIFLFFSLLSCSQSTTVGQVATTPASTGDITIEYDNYFTNGFRTLGTHIFFFQKASTSHYTPSGYSHTVYLKALGGTVDSGAKSAYTWKATNLPSWLELEEEVAYFTLKAVSDPTTWGETSISLQVTSNENKTITVQTKIVVLFNNQDSNEKPNVLNAYKDSIFLSVENPDAINDNYLDDDKIGGTSDINGSCKIDTSPVQYQAILPTQIITAHAGRVGKDCYAFHIPANDIKVSFDIRSLASDDNLTACRNLSTHDDCGYIIQFDNFAPAFDSTSNFNMQTESYNTGFYLQRRVNDTQFIKVPMSGNALSNYSFDKVSEQPLVYRMFFSSIENNFMGSNDSMNLSQKCYDDNTATLCEADPFNSTSTWSLSEGWYYLVIDSTQDNGGDYHQKYTISMNINLN